MPATIATSSGNFDSWDERLRFGRATALENRGAGGRTLQERVACKLEVFRTSRRPAAPKDIDYSHEADIVNVFDVR